MNNSKKKEREDTVVKCKEGRVGRPWRIMLRQLAGSDRKAVKLAEP